MDMRKDWIRTDEERKLMLLRNLAKQAARSNQFTEQSQLMMDLPIVMRRRKRLRAIMRQAPTEKVT